MLRRKEREKLKTAWVLTDGKIGMLNQALGLVEAVGAAMDGPDGLAIEQKTLRPAAPWRWLPPLAWPIGLTGKRSEEHTSELQSLMRISYAVFCLKKKQENNTSDLLSHARIN